MSNSIQNNDFSIDLMTVDDHSVSGSFISDRVHGFAFRPLEKKVWTFDPPLKENQLEIKAAITKRILSQVYL